jgi:hypothetical protein
VEEEGVAARRRPLEEGGVEEDARRRGERGREGVEEKIW